MKILQLKVNKTEVIDILYPTSKQRLLWHLCSCEQDELLHPLPLCGLATMAKISIAVPIKGLVAVPPPSIWLARKDHCGQLQTQRLDLEPSVKRLLADACYRLCRIHIIAGFEEKQGPIYRYELHPTEKSTKIEGYSAYSGIFSSPTISNPDIALPNCGGSLGKRKTKTKQPSSSAETHPPAWLPSNMSANGCLLQELLQELET
ncbi:hypothetical protein BTVI_129648 [Pitangus sulphuratus]|nr:hypothetical protein BTVI_129648 [Pitangus sulphuratus]